MAWSKLLAVGVTLGLAAPTLAAPAMEAPLPPAPAWKGRSEKLIVKPSDPWITPSERSGLTTTPSYAETRAWLDRLDAASPLIRIESFGKTAQGRDLFVVIASKDGDRLDPDKPVLLAQAGIHAGEIDGKDAGLMLLRDIALKGKSGLLDKANLLFVPMFNADGHERVSPYNRPNQRGPVNQGWRTTAQNLNLNRDYAKIDSPEMQAMVGLLNRTDPALYLDLHVTDGTDYQYDITFGFEGWDGRYARSQQIGAWLDKIYRPAVTEGLKRSGHIPGPLVFAVDNRDPDAGIALTASPPRFSTSYGDLRRIAAVLVENHSLKPYRQRVLGTYVLLEESLKALAAQGDALKAAIRADRAARPAAVTATWVDKSEPIAEVDFLGIAHDYYQSPASGGREIRWLGKPRTQRIKLFGQVPGVQIAPPAAYWVPATKPEVIERLRLHGISVETLDAPRTVTVEMLRLVEPKLAGSASEGHVPVSAARYVREKHEELYPAGSVRVPVDQPLGELAVMLLEPESPDSFFAWNFFPEILARTEYIEGYAIAPLAERMLAEQPALKAEFEAKLKADPAFAGDPDRRLGWFYERTPYFDQRYLLYPVGREID